MLREYEQLSYAENAELLKLPVNTVRSRLFRSRMALKSYLDPKRLDPEQKSGEVATAADLAEGVKLTRAEGEAI
jgi:hypothetical protein